MCNHNITQDPTCDLKKFAIPSILRPEKDLISNWGHKFKRTVSFVNLVLFIDEEIIETPVVFDCSLTEDPEAATLNEQINQE